MPTPLIQSGLPSVPAGLPDKEHRLLTPIYLAFNSMARTVSQATGMVTYTPGEMAAASPIAALGTQQFTRIFLRASEEIAFGKMVHIFLEAGEMSAQLADSSTSARPAAAVCNQIEGVPAGTTGEFLLYTGYTGGISDTVLGATYYLGTLGNSQLARPSAAGSIIQAVGIGFGSLGFYAQISSLFIQN
jgi:hypothetical protein